MKPWWGERRAIWILPNMSPSTVHHNPLLDPPEPNPKELCIGYSKVQWSLVPQGFWLEYSSSLPLHLQLLSTHQNPTIPSPRKSSLPNMRANHIPHSNTSKPTIISSLCTKYTIIDHIPRAKHCPKGTGMHKELIVNKLINSMVSGRIIFYYCKDIFQVPYLLQLSCYLPQ